MAEARALALARTKRLRDRRRTMLARICRALDDATGNVSVVSSLTNYTGVDARMVPDRWPGEVRWRNHHGAAGRASERPASDTLFDR